MKILYIGHFCYLMQFPKRISVIKEFPISLLSEKKTPNDKMIFYLYMSFFLHVIWLVHKTSLWPIFPKVEHCAWNKDWVNLTKSFEARTRYSPTGYSLMDSSIEKKIELNVLWDSQIIHSMIEKSANFSRWCYVNKVSHGWMFFLK